MGIMCVRTYRAGVLVLALAAAIQPGTTRADAEIPEESLTLEELINLPERDLAKVDIATMNLICTEGLPGSERIDRKALLAKLDAWAAYVAYETNRHRYRFEQNPEEYNHSWGEFAMLMMAMTLQQDLGVRYNPDQIPPEDDPNRFDFTRSQDLFINGLLEGTGGTCTSMPVLYIAIGRRLGYPLKLVTTAEHSFLRWDDPETGERFNIEGTSRGYGSYSDESYRTWPREWNAAERDSSNFLKSLSPRGELAVFMTTRGDNLFFSGRLHDALHCYETAIKLSPRNYAANFQYRHTSQVIANLEAQRRAERLAQEVEDAYQRHERRRWTDPRLMVPGMPVVPTAYAASSRQSGFGPPTSTGAFAVPGYPVPQSSSAFDFLDVDNRSPTSMNAWLEETNRRNEALARYARAILYPKKRDETQQSSPPQVSNFPVAPNAQWHLQSIGAGSAVRTTPGQNVAPNGPRSGSYPGFGTPNQGVSGSLSAGRPSAVELFERMKRQNGVRGPDGNVSRPEPPIGSNAQWSPYNAYSVPTVPHPSFPRQGARQ